MNFGEAFEAALQGARITAPGWNGKGMWFSAQAGDVAQGLAEPPFLPVYIGPALGVNRPHLYLHDAQGHHVPWLPSMTDLFRTDYELAPGFYGEPVRAWGCAAIEIGRRGAAVLMGSGPPDEDNKGDGYDGGPYSDDANADWSWARWVYLPA